MASQDADTSRVLQRMVELDRRKLAAAKTAKDAQDAAQREAWRKAKRRQRAAAMQARTKPTTECEPARELPTFDQLFGEQAKDPAKSTAKPNEIRENLNKLANDRRSPASARVTALRTLAEMDGLVGKLQNKPDATADQPLATLTREQLENELARLRAEVAGRGT